MELKELRKQCKERKIPIISPATEVFLGKMLRKRKPKICLEIGGAVGYSSMYIGEVIKDRGGVVTSFEISYPAYQEGLGNAKAANCHNIISYPYDVRQAPIKKLVAACPPNRRGPVDFIFIDGQKNQYGEYLEIVGKLSSPHTVIVIDDVIKYHNKLSSLYGFLGKKQIKLLRPSKKQMKSSFFEGKKNTDEGRVYEILQLDPDDGVMIIRG